MNKENSTPKDCQEHQPAIVLDIEFQDGSSGTARILVDGLIEALNLYGPPHRTAPTPPTPTPDDWQEALRLLRGCLPYVAAYKGGLEYPSDDIEQTYRATRGFLRKHESEVWG